jgi:hypothetical protein
MSLAIAPNADAVEFAKIPGKLDFEVEIDGYASFLGFYGGLSWNAGVIDGQAAFGKTAPDCGYITGITSGKQTAFNGGGKALGFSAEGTFTFKSAQMTAAWSAELTVDVYGYRDGKRVYHETVVINDKAPTLEVFNFKNVDEVKMKPSGAVIDPDQPYTGNHFVLDDAVITKLTSAPTPEHAAPSVVHAFGHDTALLTHDLVASAVVHHDMAIAALV